MARKKDLRNHSGKKSGARNTTSKNICVILQKIEELEFVNRVSPGSFKNQKSSPKIEIIGYDDRTKKYFLNVFGGEYIQKVTLNVPAKDPSYEARIKACI